MGLDIQETLNELVVLVKRESKSRYKFRDALYPEFDIVKANIELEKELLRLAKILRDLTQAQKRFEQAVVRLKAMMDKLNARVEAGFAEAAAEREQIRQDVNQLRQDVNQLRERMEAGFAEAAAEREQIRQDVKEIKQDVNQLREEMVVGFTEAAAERRVLSERLDKADADRVVMKRDLAELKGTSHEQYYRREAHSVFGAYLRRGKEMKSEIAELLHDAVDEESISISELRQVLAADLLWAGKERLSKEQIILVVEASWLAELTDVERAVTRADILRRIGLRAVPVVAGREWAEGIADMAHAVGVATTTNGRMDNASWESALKKVL